MRGNFEITIDKNKDNITVISIYNSVIDCSRTINVISGMTEEVDAIRREISYQIGVGVMELFDECKNIPTYRVNK